MREVFRLSTVKMASDIRPAPQPRLAAFIVLPSIMTRKFTTVIARAQFYVLRTKSNIQLRQEIGGENEYFHRKRTVGVYVCFALPSIWTRNFATVFEIAHIIRS